MKLGKKIRMRDDCCQAFEQFLEKANALRHVSMSVQGVFYTDRNEMAGAKGKKKPEKEGGMKSAPQKGSRMILSFGAAGDGLRTTYTFRTPELAGKNKDARSLRFVPGGAKSEGGSRPAVECVAGRPTGDIGSGSMDPEAAGRAELVTAMAANSLSYGHLFPRYSDLCDGLTARCAEEPDGILVPDGQEDFDRLYDLLHGSSEGEGLEAAIGAAKAGAALPRGTFQERAASWYLSTDVLHRNGAGDACLDASPDQAAAASEAMGLDALYGALCQADAELEAAGGSGTRIDLGKLLDPSTEQGRDALSGLCHLAAYKMIRDDGRHAGRDVRDMPYAGVAPDASQVYDRLVFARAEAEHGRRALEAYRAEGMAYAPACCYPKMRGGAEDGAGKGDAARVGAYTRYRFLRAAALSEDPDMPSGTPLARIAYVGDASKKIDPGAIAVRWTDRDGAEWECGLRPLLEGSAAGGPARELMDGFPMLSMMAAQYGGVDAAMTMAAKAVEKDPGRAPFDMLELECDVFSSAWDAGLPDRKTKKGAMALLDVPRDGGTLRRRIDAMERTYLAGAEKAAGGNRPYRYQVGLETGVPDWRAGSEKLGGGILDAVPADAREGLPAKEMLALAAGARGSGRTAAALRRMDGERASALAAAGTSPADGWAAVRAAMPGGYAGAYVDALAGYAGRIGGTDPEDARRASREVNDFMVLADCYNLRTAEELESLAGGIRDLYSGKPAGRFLYMPQDRHEANALRAAFAGEERPPLEDGLAPIGAQASPEGLAGVLARAVRDSGDASKEEAVAKALRLGALEASTFDDTRLADALGSFSSLRASQRKLDGISGPARDAQEQAYGFLYGA